MIERSVWPAAGDKLRHAPVEATLREELAEPFAAADLEQRRVAAPFQRDDAPDTSAVARHNQGRPLRAIFSAQARSSGFRNADGLAA
jgi:hypothetical protein